MGAQPYHKLQRLLEKAGVEKEKDERWFFPRKCYHEVASYSAGFCGYRCFMVLLYGGFRPFFYAFLPAGILFFRNRQRAFQKLNHLFYKGFFGLVKGLIPACRWEIPKEVREIRSSVIVCNHRSYIDPILLISLYPRHTTIAKARLFHIPIFGKMLTLSGYIPSKGRGAFRGPDD